MILVGGNPKAADLACAIPGAVSDALCGMAEGAITEFIWFPALRGKDEGRNLQRCSFDLAGWGDIGEVQENKCMLRCADVYSIGDRLGVFNTP